MVREVRKRFPAAASSSFSQTAQTSSEASQTAIETLNSSETERKLRAQHSQQAAMPVSIKIRILPDLRRTVELVRRAEHAGVAWITVHGKRAFALLCRFGLN